MAGYIGNAPVPQATQTRDNFTATAGQTSFATSGYTPGYLDVYLNGVRLDESDYTATNGSDVVLDTGAAVDDVVTVVAFQTFEVSADIDNAEVKTDSLEVDRQSTDGDAIVIKKDGTTVGSIGADGGDLFIGTGDTGIRFSDSANAIVGQNPSTVANSYDFVDLGTSGIRFKDLFLSGGVYLGGTGSANHLDDYEEGTWTATDDSAAGLTLTQSQGGTYVKVGKMCYVQIYITFPTTSNGDVVQIGGLPFTAGGGYAHFAVRVNGYATNDCIAQVAMNNTFLNLRHNNVGLTNNQISGAYVLFSGVYQTT